MRAYIVENSEIIRDRLALLLADIEGLELIGQTGSARIATEELSQLQPDVVLVDVKLSDGSGLDVLESMQAQGLKTIAIVITLDPYAQYRKRAIELGAIHFIDKATELESLQLILGKVVAEQRVTLKAA